MSKLYLAYGSNLNKAQMAVRCPDAVPVGVTRIPNYELVFRRSYLTIEPKKGCSVPVGVWEISEEDEKNLDRYEGFPRFYDKQLLPLMLNGFDESGKKKVSEKVADAIVYVMNDGFPIQMPTGHYYETVRQGYIDFGFKHEDFEKLWKAMDYARRKGVS